MGKRLKLTSEPRNSKLPILKDKKGLVRKRTGCVLCTQPPNSVTEFFTEQNYVNVV